MERRAERFIKRIIENQGEFLKSRPKKVKRVAGQVASKIKHTITRAPEIDERTHLSEHDGLDQIDLNLQIPEGIGTSSSGEVDNSLSSKFPRHMVLAVEIADREKPDPDLDWNPNRPDSVVEEVPLELWRSRISGRTREEKLIHSEPRADQND